MKKLIMIAIVMLGFAGISQAQTKPSKTGVKPTVKTEKLSTAKQTTPVKADGTPDMRYSVNKTAAKPLKADGTPDMRYKTNKTTATKTETKTAAKTKAKN